MLKEDLGKWKVSLVGEILLFGLLGKALYGEPDKAWLDELIREDVFSEPVFGAGQPDVEFGLELLRKWTIENTGGLSNNKYEALQQDYVVLFIGPVKVSAPPWESVYFSEKRLVFQEQTFEVRNFYRQFGLEIELVHKEPDDHIGLEISFVSYLAKLALQALEDGDEKKFADLIDAKSQFLSKHLLLWGASWCALVIEYANTDFYKGLGHLVLGSLLSLGDIYNLPVPQKDRK